MTTLPTFENSKSPSDKAVSRADLMHACMRNQLQVHDLLIKAVDASGMTQKELAKRTGIDEATISRILGQPKNLEMNTISKILHAACGATLGFSLSYPRAQRSGAVLLVDARPSTSENTMLRKFFYYAPSEYESANVDLLSATNQDAFETIASTASGTARVREATHA